MNTYRTDLHIQTPYTAATADNLTIENLAETAELKGVDVLGTGDCLHPEWRESLYEHLRKEDGYYRLGSACFIPSVEVKDRDMVHHLILTRDLDDFGELRERWKDHSKIDGIGVPTINLNGEDLAKDVFDVGGIVGPAHVFIQWQSLYMSFNSIEECYGEYTDDVSFYELGLSACSSMAEGIDELSDKVCLSNSDLHTVHKLGREVNELKMNFPSFDELKMALEGRQDRFQRNIGVPPQESKYFLSACIECGRKYRLEDARRSRWKCTVDGGKVRKGTKHRVEELAGREPEIKETEDYLLTPPLSKIIKWATGVSAVDERRERWREMVDALGPEIDILVEKSIDEIKEFDEDIGEFILNVRRNDIEYVPGGGGEEGYPAGGGSWEYQSVAQKSLEEFT